eukprot:2335973-Rhodomonas_salina.3
MLLPWPAFHLFPSFQYDDTNPHSSTMTNSFFVEFASVYDYPGLVRLGAEVLDDYLWVTLEPERSLEQRLAQRRQDYDGDVTASSPCFTQLYIGQLIGDPQLDSTKREPHHSPSLWVAA